jgi:pimeloyl-ACP methyl ester carboxylesterase
MKIYKDGIAEAQMKVLQEARHFPNVEQPDAFNERASGIS